MRLFLSLEISWNRPLNFLVNSSSSVVTLCCTRRHNKKKKVLPINLGFNNLILSAQILLVVWNHTAFLFITNCRSLVYIYWYLFVCHPTPTIYFITLQRDTISSSLDLRKPYPEVTPTFLVEGDMQHPSEPRLFWITFTERCRNIINISDLPSFIWK